VWEVLRREQLEEAVVLGELRWRQELRGEPRLRIQRRETLREVAGEVLNLPGAEEQRCPQVVAEEEQRYPQVVAEEEQRYPQVVAEEEQRYPQVVAEELRQPAVEVVRYPLVEVKEAHHQPELQVEQQHYPFPFLFPCP
jgi:hypothetical protein